MYIKNTILKKYLNIVKKIVILNCMLKYVSIINRFDNVLNTSELKSFYGDLCSPYELVK